MKVVSYKTMILFGGIFVVLPVIIIALVTHAKTNAINKWTELDKLLYHRLERELAMIDEIPFLNAKIFKGE